MSASGSRVSTKKFTVLFLWVLHSVSVVSGWKPRYLAAAAPVNMLTLFPACTVTKTLIYKTTTRTSNLHKNTVFCLLQYVWAERRHFLESQYTCVNNSLKYNTANPGGRSLPGIAGSNPVWGMHVCLFWLSYLSGRGLCGEPITRPEESPTECSVSQCDRKATKKRRPWPTRGCSPWGEKCIIYYNSSTCYIVAKFKNVRSGNDGETFMDIRNHIKISTTFMRSLGARPNFRRRFLTVKCLLGVWYWNTNNTEGNRNH